MIHITKRNHYCLRDIVRSIIRKFRSFRLNSSYDLKNILFLGIFVVFLGLRTTKGKKMVSQSRFFQKPLELKTKKFGILLDYVNLYILHSRIFIYKFCTGEMKLSTFFSNLINNGRDCCKELKIKISVYRVTAN